MDPHETPAGEDDLAVELLGEARDRPPTSLPRPEPGTAIVVQAGTGPPREPEVFLHLDALTVILEHAQQHERTETGGLLVGDVSADPHGTYVRVEAAAPARDALRTSTSLTFTHEAWGAMLAEREQHWPAARVVGWFHTHPGLHVFLSEPDQFIHTSLFGGPNDIAIVVDHRRLEWAVFRWHGDRLEAAARFFIYAQMGQDDARVRAVLAGLAARL